MIPKDQNIFSAVNLLVLLFRSNKQKLPRIPDFEQHTLIITTEHLSGANISIPVFVNTLHLLSEKGYLFASSVYEKEYHELIRQFATEENYGKVLKELKDKGVNEITAEQKIALADAIEKMAPPSSHFQINREEMLKEHMTFEECLNNTRELMANHKDTDISTVILMPFRSIENLLDKMNDGKTFDEIQDSSIWYDATNHIFHIGEKIVETHYQGKPNIEHFVLEKLNDYLDDGVIWYDDINSFKPRSLKDALTNFLDKKKELKKIFTVHSDRLAFDTEAFK